MKGSAKDVQKERIQRRHFQVLRGSYPLHIIHNRMGLQKERRELSWKLQGKCFMIKIFPCIYGHKRLEQLCMYRTVLHIEYSRTRHLKKSFLARNQKSSILEYSVVQYTYTFRKKRGQSYILQERRVYLWPYSEILKDYRIYFPGFKKIDISRDVTFDKDSTYNKSRKILVEYLEETKYPGSEVTTTNPGISIPFSVPF